MSGSWVGLPLGLFFRVGRSTPTQKRVSTPPPGVELFRDVDADAAQTLRRRVPKANGNIAYKYIDLAVNYYAFLW